MYGTVRLYWDRHPLCPPMLSEEEKIRIKEAVLNQMRLKLDATLDDCAKIRDSNLLELEKAAAELKQSGVANLGMTIGETLDQERENVR